MSVVLVGVGIVALVVIALAVAVARPNRTVDYPTGTPEAAFQDFYQAWEAGDIDAAYEFLSPAVKADLTLVEYRRADSEQSWPRDGDRRVVVVGADVRGDTAVLQLRIDEFYDGGLGGERYSREQTVRLVRDGSAWLIDEPLLGVNIVYPY
jgi:hypothetical protein